MYIRYNLRGTSLIKCRYTSSNLALQYNHIALRKFHKKGLFWKFVWTHNEYQMWYSLSLYEKREYKVKQFILVIYQNIYLETYFPLNRNV